MMSDDFCCACHGDGYNKVKQFVPYESVVRVTCQACEGTGEWSVPCSDCGEPVMMKSIRIGFNRGDGGGPVYYCKECVSDEMAAQIMGDFERSVIAGHEDVKN